MKPPVARQTLLGLALTLSVIASVWVSRQELLDSEIVEPAGHQTKTQDVLAVHTDGQTPERNIQEEGLIRLDLDRLAARHPDGTDIDPFRTKTWFLSPPPPPPPPPPSPPLTPPPSELFKPSVPPLPFQFIGRMEEIGKSPVFYLVNGDEFHPVSVGDKFAENYRLEDARDGALSIRYLPLSEVQILSIGSGE